MKLTTTIRKKFRVRNKLKKVAKDGRLRLCISRSTKNISAQIIDDSKNITLLSASSVEKDIKGVKVKNKSELSDSSKFFLNNINKTHINDIFDINVTNDILLESYYFIIHFMKIHINYMTNLKGLDKIEKIYNA